MARYLDLSGTAKSVSFATPSEPLKNLRDTPEGFLMCLNVPLARTGDQVYLAREVPQIQPTRDGRVVTERRPEDVFRQETIDSFNGKPFTNTHPWDDVVPSNYSTHLKGVVINPRQGEGEDSDKIVGDIMVYDAATIRQIKAGKREVSAGYDADYVRVGPGRGRQVNILGNHVSLVDAGRCGPACAIRDGKTNMAGKGNTRFARFMDGMTGIFKAHDAGQDIGEHVEKLADELGINEGDEGDETRGKARDGVTQRRDSEGNVVVDVNLHGFDGRRRTRDEGEDAPPPSPPGGEDENAPVTRKDLEEIMAPMVQAMTALSDRMDSVESHVDGASDPGDQMTQDAVAGARLLAPDMKLPTFDAAPGSKDQRKALVALKRAALRDAMSTVAGQRAIAPLVDSPRPNFATMSEDLVNVIFRAATQSVRDAADSGFLDFAEATVRFTPESGKEPRALTASDINSINRKHYNRV